MDLSYQKELLALFGEESDLPVTLNSHYMLKPEKSMLYLFGASADPVSHPEDSTAKPVIFPTVPMRSRTGRFSSTGKTSRCFPKAVLLPQDALWTVLYPIGVCHKFPGLFA